MSSDISVKVNSLHPAVASNQQVVITLGG